MPGPGPRCAFTRGNTNVQYRSRATDLVRGTYNEVQLMYQPLEAGRKHIHVHLIGASP